MESILTPVVGGPPVHNESLLPEPGYGLLENPYFEEGKKKKKKK